MIILGGRARRRERREGRVRGMEGWKKERGRVRKGKGERTQIQFDSTHPV